MGDVHCRFLSFCTLTTAVNSWQFLPGKTKKKRKRMRSAVPIDHTSNGRRSCVANASDQTRRPAKKKNQNPDEQKARVSHHNKWCAKRQLCKWARPAALLLQLAVNWKIFCAQHGCTWITLCCTMLYNRALSVLCCCGETHSASTVALKLKESF